MVLEAQRSDGLHIHRLQSFCTYVCWREDRLQKYLFISEKSGPTFFETILVAPEIASGKSNDGLISDHI